MRIRETVYEHTAGDLVFYITANDQWSINMIRRLNKKYPDDVKIIIRNKDGSLLAEAPKDWMKIIPRKKPIKDCQKELAETPEKGSKPR